MKKWNILGWAIISIGIFLGSCNEKKPSKILVGAALQHYCVQKLTDVIVYDIFTPPVASRIYVYTNLAYYEALKPMNSKASAIIPLLNGFESLPITEAGKKYDYRLSAATAFMKVAKALVFSKDSIGNAEKEIQLQFNELDKDVFDRSIAWGEAIASTILKRAGNDNYKVTRGMPRYSVFKETGKWIQTPPDYSDAIEPYWKLIKPLKMDSAAQFRPAAPPAYSLDKTSQYYKELMELYTVSKQLTKLQDTIAYYWDDNPFVSEHTGHLTYANKKTTPVGHWMGIIAILCGDSKLDDMATAKTYALSSCAIFDAFISCWEEKFRSKTVRPISVIRENIESEWNALLQTPPFPEYTSGHSVVSAAASTVLTHLFGNNKAFHDTTELQYLGMQRSFTSIEQASDEAGISRLYGGIHYRSAIVNGKSQGNQVGNLFIQLIQ